MRRFACTLLVVLMLVAGGCAGKRKPMTICEIARQRIPKGGACVNGEPEAGCPSCYCICQV